MGLPDKQSLHIVKDEASRQNLGCDAMKSTLVLHIAGWSTCKCRPTGLIRILMVFARSDIVGVTEVLTSRSDQVHSMSSLLVLFPSRINVVEHESSDRMVPPHLCGLQPS